VRVFASNDDFGDGFSYSDNPISGHVISDHIHSNGV
jgi:hypothetical protein